MPVETPARQRVALEAGRVDARGLTITTAIALTAHDALADLGVGDELALLVDPFAAIVPDLQAWCRLDVPEHQGPTIVEVMRQSDVRL